MAKLTNIRFATGPKGQKKMWDLPAKVSGNGKRFFVACPDELEFIAKAMADRQKEDAAIFPEVTFGKDPNGRTSTLWAMADNIDAPEAFIFEAAKTYMSAETTESLVLLYSTDNKFAVLTDGDWQLHGLKWPNTHLDGYRLEIFARVYTKTTTVTNEATSYRYSLAHDDDLIRRLNAHPTDAKGVWDDWCQELHKDVHEIPYTVEAAMFFATAMLKIAEIGKALEILDNPTELTKALKDGALPRIGS